LTLRWKSLVLVAVAFGIVEAGLVSVYRTLLDPHGTLFPLLQLPDGVLWIEQAREVATLVLLVGVANLLSSRFSSAFAGFLLAFGVWDLVYYGALLAFLGWPRHLGDWDLLFLVPVPWLAPVWAPMLVSLCMVAAGSLALGHESRRGAFHVGWAHLAVAAGGGGLCIASFLRDAGARQLEAVPVRFSLEWLLAGLGLGGAAFAHAWWRNRSPHRHSPDQREIRMGSTGL
jgi:hypothetical protein